MNLLAQKMSRIPSGSDRRKNLVLETVRCYLMKPMLVLEYAFLEHLFELQVVLHTNNFFLF